MSVRRRKFDSDFKSSAVRLTEEPGRTVKEVAENFGITQDLLYRWRKEHHSRNEKAFPWSLERSSN